MSQAASAKPSAPLSPDLSGPTKLPSPVAVRGREHHGNVCAARPLTPFAAGKDGVGRLFSVAPRLTPGCILSAGAWLFAAHLAAHPAAQGGVFFGFDEGVSQLSVATLQLVGSSLGPVALE